MFSKIVLPDSPLAAHHVRGRFMAWVFSLRRGRRRIKHRLVRVLGIVWNQWWLRWRWAHCHSCFPISIVVARSVHPPRCHRDYSS